jgi:hypothetical protein
MENKRMKIGIISLYTALCLALVTCGSLDCYAAGPSGKASGDAETVKTAETGKGASAATADKGGEISPDTVILTVNSTPVYWPEFHFWLNYIEKYYRSYRDIEKITDWNAEQNGMKLKEFFLSNAVGYAVKDRAIEAKAKELGITLTEADQAEVKKKRDSDIKIYGTSEYIRIVCSMYGSVDVYNYLTQIDYLGNYLFERVYGAKGEKCTNEKVSDYVKTAGLMCAKSIFLSKTGADGKALSEARQAERQKVLADILNQLDATKTPETLFDTLMDKYSEDREGSLYPDGRLFVAGGVGEEFEGAYLKLEEGRYSRIVKAPDGWYVIMRMPISPDMVADSSGNTLRYVTAYQYLFKNQVEEWAAGVKVEYKEAYHKIDPERIDE